ncbi:hypothetical protein ACKKBF_B08725 [Auxenochlorella protothecoides x Auxenochlorella symbiontica]
MARALTRMGPGRMAECAENLPRPEDYLTINGFRFVKPYHFDFSCSVKQRWGGQALLDVFSKEFPARSRDYYRAAIEQGRLRLEGKPSSPDTILAPGQRMRHAIHRHEPPCLGGDIPVLGVTPGLVAVGKPAGMPVHVSGQYRKNTVLGVLQAHRTDLGPLHPCHRLDKPVSGVLIFARSPAAADALRLQIEAHEVCKVYVARVMGRFPDTPDPLVVDVPLSWDQKRNHVTACPGAAAVGDADSDLERGGGAAQAPVPEAGAANSQPSPPRDGAEEDVAARAARRHAFRAQRRERARAKQEAQAAQAARAAAPDFHIKAAKHAVTEVRLLGVAPDGQTSLVECRPRTGRTHQIRVHLQHVGHPIANDAQYGGRYAGPLASRVMAAALGVAWDQMRAAAGIPAWQPDGGPAGPGTVSGGEAGPEPASRGVRGSDASSDGWVAPEASSGDAAATASKRPRVAAGNLGAADARGADAFPIREPPRLQAAFGSARNADAYAQNQAFRQGEDYRAPEGSLDDSCPHCPYLAPMDYPLDLRPLWLHARSYACAEWEFEAPLPDWAAADYCPDAHRQGAGT